jgi:hypothetical protein
MKLYGFRLALNPVISLLRRRPCDDGGRDWSDATTSQGTTWSHQKLGQGKGGFLRDLRVSVAQLTL